MMLLAAGVCAHLGTLDMAAARSRVVLICFVSTFMGAGIILNAMSGQTTIRLALASITILGIVSLPYSNAAMPTITVGNPASHRLWSIALQHPSHELLRKLPKPSGSGNLRVIIQLGNPYYGFSSLDIDVNGKHLGLMKHSTIDVKDSGSPPDPLQLEIDVPADMVDSVPHIRVLIRQPSSDPLLRIRVLATTLGNIYGEQSVWFGSDGHWLPGVPHPSDGLSRDASPVMWIEQTNGQK